MLKRMFALSDQGAKDLNKGIAATTLSNLCLIAPVSLLVMVVWELLNVISGSESSIQDNAGSQSKWKEQKNRRPDGKCQDAGFNHIPRTEHTAKKSACFYEVRRYDINIMVILVAHVLPRF